MPAWAGIRDFALQDGGIGMNKTRVGLVLVLVVSLAIGVLAGLVFLSLFKSQVPVAALSDFVKTSSPVTFVATGLGFGLVIAVWSVLVAWVAPRFAGRSADRQHPNKLT
jgi:hypothetical protein